MTDDRAERIRELKQRIVEWEHEQNFAIQQERDLQRELSETLSLSLRIVAVGSTPSAVWIVCWVAATTATESLVGQLLHLCGALLVFGVITAASARASGLAAHWWFRRTRDLERLATIVIALLADALLFGWTIVIVNW